MSKSKPVHVVPREDGWAVIREGAARASSAGRSTQATATEAARREHTELIVHGRDGQIRARDSYGNDPHPPKG